MNTVGAVAGLLCLAASGLMGLRRRRAEQAHRERMARWER